MKHLTLFVFLLLANCATSVTPPGASYDGAWGLTPRPTVALRDDALPGTWDGTHLALTIAQPPQALTLTGEVVDGRFVGAVDVQFDRNDSGVALACQVTLTSLTPDRVEGTITCDHPSGYGLDGRFAAWGLE